MDSNGTASLPARLTPARAPDAAHRDHPWRMSRLLARSAVMTTRYFRAHIPVVLPTAAAENVRSATCGQVAERVPRLPPRLGGPLAGR